MKKYYDTIVVGAGASGMMAAGTAAESGNKVLVLEKENEVGKKLSITGGGRCNITNAEFDTRKLLENYGEAKKYLFSPFSQFSVEDTFKFFESKGLPLVIEARKRAFPKSQKASDVVDVLKKFMLFSGAELLLNHKVKDIEYFQDAEYRFKVIVDKNKEFFAKTVIFASGGPSGKRISSELPQPWRILAKLGHSVNLPNPNLVPLKTKAKFVHRLSGISLSFVALRFKVGEKSRMKKLGKVLFTHFGVSGPTVINASKEALDILKQEGRLTLSIDFFPDTEFDKLDRRLISLMERHPNKKMRNILSELLPEELAKTILYLVDKNLAEKNANNVTREERRKIVHWMKDFHFNIVGAMDMDWAIVADGGVPLDEVNTKTMESKIVPGLFLTGDVLNINRPSGGFSLQLCWTTGYVAAKNVKNK